VCAKVMPGEAALDDQGDPVNTSAMATHKATSISGASTRSAFSKRTRAPFGMVYRHTTGEPIQLSRPQDRAGTSIAHDKIGTLN